MDRLEIIKALIKKKKFSNYLEIGVFNGHILFNVNCKSKIAVDPHFRFKLKRKIFKTIFNPSNIYNKYFEKTSDDFFKENASEVFEERGIDIALVDGMHEYSFVQRDVENILKYLQEDGIIVLHDCNPKTKDASCTFEIWKSKGYPKPWNGDVWKVIIYLRSFYEHLNVFVLDCDEGIGIVCNRSSEKKMSFTKKEIENLTFEDLSKNRIEWLNLKKPEYFYKYFKI